jgi:hypothetical protein
MRRLARHLEGFGENHRDDLAIVPDPVGGQRHDRRTGIAAIAEQLCRLDRAFHIAMGQMSDTPGTEGLSLSSIFLIRPRAMALVTRNA